VQPEAVSHASVLQALPSSQLTGVFTQPVAGLQLSFVHVLWSSQSTTLCVHPEAGSHSSVLQRLPSLQLTGS
jgi:hypothetical protein